ncbi:MAG: hypothetical protein IKK09_00355 [Clostridia bacterium]|nr:hypothetical protein [Clostridia bacterium]
MKKYIKPEIEIVEFDIVESVTEEIGSDLLPDLDLQSDEVFYGIEAGEEGYLIHN